MKISNIWKTALEKEIDTSYVILMALSRGSDEFGDGRQARLKLDMWASLQVARATKFLAAFTFLLALGTIFLAIATLIK
jgi:hypothetical protein